MVFTDQLNREIELKPFPQRIISIVPSQTELLYDLGLNDQVVGITKFCTRPAKWFRTKTRVGGTKKLNIEKIRSLKPDLIIGNKEENDRSQIEELMKEFPVWMSDIKNLNDAFEMIKEIGKMTNKEVKAMRITDDIYRNFLKFKVMLRQSELRTAYCIWNDPMMFAGGDTFISDMLNQCGLENVFEDQERYPEINAAQIRKAKPDLIFLSTEPFPFKEKHLQEFNAICPKAKVLLVDGEMFSWYGSRLLNAPDYFKSLIVQITT